jgi:hypothetical protein
MNATEKIEAALDAADLGNFMKLEPAIHNAEQWGAKGIAGTDDPWACGKIAASYAEYALTLADLILAADPTRR